MAIVTSRQLRTWADGLEKTAGFGDLREASVRKGRRGRTVVFLSHSHTDDDLVGYARDVLFAEDVGIYVDWLDDEVPEHISPATATYLKDKIVECGKFVMLASDSALRSAWVPWELGYADSAKGLANVAVWPISRRAKAWPGTEYVGIYNRIELAAGGQLAVFPPGRRRGHVLSSWLGG